MCWVICGVDSRVEIEGAVDVKWPMWRTWPGELIETRAERTVKISEVFWVK